jgi:integrating conjugative element protein (TIGR03758 family)
MNPAYRSQLTGRCRWMRLRFGITGLLMLLVACAALAAGAYADFLTALARRESLGNSHAVNQYGYAGLYQMGEGALIDAGYYRRDGTTKNDWRGGWTGKGGINNLNDFLNSPATQTQAITGYHDALWGQITARGLDNKVGQTFKGVPITPSGLIAAAHLIGTGGLRSCLNGGTCTDANNTTALSYMGQFGGFDVASLTGSTPPDGGGGPVTPVNTGGTGGATASNTSAPFPTGSAVSTSAAFAAGAGVDMADIRQFILGTLSVTLLLWTAWTTRALFSNWRFGKATLMDMEFNLMSSVTLMSVVLFIVLA